MEKFRWRELVRGLGRARPGLARRIREARLVIKRQSEASALGIPMIRASVFRCFLDVLAKDAGLLRDDRGAVVVWNMHLSDATGGGKGDEQA